MIYDVLQKEWHPTKNTGLILVDFPPGSGKKVWWRCEKGHEWEASIGKRTKGNKCPYCMGKKVGDDNSLFKVNPLLAKEWNYTKNDRKTPKDVLPGSNKKVWWICEKGHEWEASPNNRKNGTGCPYCSGRFVTLETSLAAKLPELAKEWHPEKNNELTPEMVKPMSNKKVWWMCDYRHEWEAKICNRSNGKKCPYCSGHKISEESFLANAMPSLLKDWHPTINKGLNPYNVSARSKLKAWWVCEKGHEWETRIHHRANGSGCPYCSGHKVSEENCLTNSFPLLLQEWHPTKNDKLSPNDVSFGSFVKVWWICNKGHEWEAQVNNRANGTGCPYCSNKKVCDDNCLAHLHPHLLKEWQYDKNLSINPYEVVGGTNRKVWWKCKKGHEWEAAISDRTNGRNCPYCSGNKVCADNCLAAVKPEVANEWHPTKNKDLTPYSVMPGSQRKVWWKCQVGHEWEAPISSRTRGDRCTECFKSTSFPEQVVFFYLGKVFQNVENRKQIKVEKRKIEADVYVPELNLAIEYDGFYFHKNRYEKDKKKVNTLRHNEIEIINMREKGLKNVNHLEVTVEKGEKRLKSAIKRLTALINQLYNLEITIDINIERDRIDILSNFIFAIKQNSIAVEFPNIAKQWNDAKNLDLSPENFSKGSQQKVWWICEKGHEWKSKICNRVKGNGCPRCSRMNG